MNLDLGSGDPSNPHIINYDGDDVIHADIDRRAYHLEVLCDAHFLPFREKAFGSVLASQVLEHFDNPLQALKEMARCSNKVVIRVPNARFSTFIGDEEHLFNWNSRTLQNLLERVFPNVDVHLSKRFSPKRGKVRRIMTFILTYVLAPNELTAVCH